MSDTRSFDRIIRSRNKQSNESVIQGPAPRFLTWRGLECCRPGWNRNAAGVSHDSAACAGTAHETRERSMLADNWPSARQWSVCTLVVAGHLAALLLMIRYRSIPGGGSSESSMAVVSIPEPVEQERSVKPVAGKAIPPFQRRSQHAAGPAPSVPAEEALPPTPDRPAHAITDWAAAAQSAAGEVLERNQENAQRRSFEHAFPAPLPPRKPGIFGSQEENHRAGRVEGGGTVYWVSDHCYFEVSREPVFPGEFRMPMVPTCKPPPTGGGNRMLEDLMPDYLKPLPAPAASK